MFKSQQPLILFMALFIMSCFTPTQKNVPSEETKPDVFLEHIDSVLFYADNEIQNITHTYEESEKEHGILVNEIKRLNRELSNRNILIGEIMSDCKSTIDSFTIINDNQKIILSQNYSMIENLTNKNTRLIQLDKENKSKIKLLEDTISNMQNSINRLNEKLIIVLNNQKSNSAREKNSKN